MTDKTLKKYHKQRAYDISHREFDKGQVVLLGDCIIEHLPMKKYLNGKPFYNNGIEGDTTELLEETLYKRAIKYKPSKCFISIGSNDIGNNVGTVKMIYENIVRIVKTLKRRSNKTKIYIVSVIPVNNSSTSKCVSEKAQDRDNFDIKMLNYYLRNYARKHKIGYVDIANHLKNDYEQLNLEYTIDGFHLNEFGYDIYKKCIEQYV
ncbi:MAG: GDSL-type esterase/lipase family protein [Candidatus Izemoplasma sp.]|nr:GDSL-type esterase/lipase family protein [Candidatus Izemoplasma sp.]